MLRLLIGLLPGLVAVAHGADAANLAKPIVDCVVLRRHLADGGDRLEGRLAHRVAQIVEALHPRAQMQPQPERNGGRDHLDPLDGLPVRGLLELLLRGCLFGN